VWAPDGKTIFYRSSGPRASHLRSREVASGEEKDLLRDDYSGAVILLNFDLSPDGSQIVFLESGAGEVLRSIKRISSNGGQPKTLLTLPKLEYSLDVTWSPDGRYVFFGKTRINSQQDISELCRVPVTGGESQNLGVTMDLMPHISCHPDGRRIAFTSGPARYDVWVMENFLPPLKAAR
jgi:Tol biopolymer transport system component